MKVKFKYLILLVITSIVVVLDQVTKNEIIQKFQLGETVSILQGFFNLTYVQNKGAAFGLFAQSHPSFRVPFFILVPCVALVSIAVLFRRLKDRDGLLAVAFSLVISGALGNLIDRLKYGFVIDFLDFHWSWKYHFPAFNVADSAICVGVGILMLDLVKNQQPAAMAQPESLAKSFKAKG